MGKYIQREDIMGYMKVRDKNISRINKISLL
jgi:hypothetical protein